MTQLLLLEDNGSVKCRKPLPSIVDQSTIKGDGEGTKFALDMSVVAAALDGDGTRANSGKLDADLVVDAPLSGAGRSDSHLKIAAATNTDAGVMPHTGAGNIPADMDRDGSDISPAAVKKMFGYIKPVGVSGSSSAEQNSSDAIEVPMLHNVSCTGGTNGSPKFTIPMAGGGLCVVDVGAWGGTVEPYAPGEVVFSGSLTECIALPPGLYEVQARCRTAGIPDTQYAIVRLLGTVVTPGVIPDCVPNSTGALAGRIGINNWSKGGSNDTPSTKCSVTQIRYLGLYS